MNLPLLMLLLIASLIFFPKVGLRDFLPAETLDKVAIVLIALLLERQQRIEATLDRMVKDGN